MKALLVYPTYPESFWSFKHALKFIGKKAAHPPLGLLTVASLMPAEWDKRLVDMNVRKLRDKDLRWADCVFISAMTIQRDSVRQVVARCRALGVKTVAGGPLFTMEPEDFPDIDHLVLNEAEVTFPQFLEDLASGNAKHIYADSRRPSLDLTPVPAWNLINPRNYAALSMQYSRGCPYDCEFCDITSLYGRKPRLKSVEQFLSELEAIYQRGWKGNVFIVDDNFIGNKVRLKREILPALIDWSEKHRHAFWFNTEASINLADDEEMMALMARAGFTSVFIGIETPSEESLTECNKFNNLNRDLIGSVKRIQRYGMQVSGGFIVGFDSDTPTIFERQINFIQQSGIITAMVGLLNAPKGTRLYERLKQENRLLHSFSGNNTDIAINFIPKMNPQKLFEGYKRIVDTIYAPHAYYQRVLEFFKDYKPQQKKSISMMRLCYVKAVFQAMLLLGVLEKERRQYWKLLLHTLRRYPGFLPEAITFAIYGYHFRKTYRLMTQQET